MEVFSFMHLVTGAPFQREREGLTIFVEEYVQYMYPLYTVYMRYEQIAVKKMWVYHTEEVIFRLFGFYYQPVKRDMSRRSDRSSIQ